MLPFKFIIVDENILVHILTEVTVADVGEARHTLSRISIRPYLYSLNKYNMLIRKSQTDETLQTNYGQHKHGYDSVGRKETTGILRNSVWDRTDVKYICTSSTVNEPGCSSVFPAALLVGIKNMFKPYKKIKTMPYITSNFTNKRKLCYSVHFMSNVKFSINTKLSQVESKFGLSCLKRYCLFKCLELLLT